MWNVITESVEKQRDFILHFRISAIFETCILNNTSSHFGVKRCCGHILFTEWQIGFIWRIKSMLSIHMSFYNLILFWGDITVLQVSLNNRYCISINNMKIAGNFNHLVIWFICFLFVAYKMIINFILFVHWSSNQTGYVLSFKVLYRISKDFSRKLVIPRINKSSPKINITMISQVKLCDKMKNQPND